VRGLLQGILGRKLRRLGKWWLLRRGTKGIQLLWSKRRKKDSINPGYMVSMKSDGKGLGINHYE
jgi:hypothetical protein